MKKYRIVQLNKNEFKIERLRIIKEYSGFFSSKSVEEWVEVTKYGDICQAFYGDSLLPHLPTLEDAEKKVIEFQTYPIIHSVKETVI